jgi:hypothetical protein
MNGAWVLLVAAVTACGSDPVRSASGAGNTGGAGGTGGAAAGTGGASDPYGVVQFGTMLHYPEQGLGYTLATAAFYRSRPPDSPGSCTTTTFGFCSVTDCSSTPTDPPEPEPEPEPDSRPAPIAGEIAIRSDSDFTVDLIPDAIGVYVQTGTVGVLLGQESMTINAAGAEVPAFSHAMTYPLLLLLTEPALADDQVVVRVPRDGDLTLAWDRGVEGVDVQVQSGGGTARLYCNAPSEGGTLTIEGAALGMLDAGTELLLLNARSEQVTAGDYVVTISSAGSVMSPDKTRRPVLILE